MANRAARLFRYRKLGMLELAVQVARTSHTLTLLITLRVIVGNVEQGSYRDELVSRPSSIDGGGKYG